MICFDDIFDYSQVSVVSFVPRKHSKSQVFDMYLLLGLSSRFSQNSRASLKKCDLIDLFRIPFEGEALSVIVSSACIKQIQLKFILCVVLGIKWLWEYF